MQVVVCNQVGSLDQLVVEERPSPDLYPTCVRIAVCENLLFLPIRWSVTKSHDRSHLAQILAIYGNVHRFGRANRQEQKVFANRKCVESRSPTINDLVSEWLERLDFYGLTRGHCICKSKNFAVLAVSKHVICHRDCTFVVRDHALGTTTCMFVSQSRRMKQLVRWPLDATSRH